MLNHKKIVVVLPAYQAEKTLEKTYNEIPFEIVDDVILVDDASPDETIKVAKRLGITTFAHERNLGYGGNQKTCYDKALELNADIIIMLHPDYQYTPKLIPAMAAMIAYGGYDMVLASRILVKGALKGGMPLYKYVANRFLTFTENQLLNAKLSEYHTGYRAYKAEVLRSIPYHKNSNDFVFDNQLIAQVMYFGFNIGEISCPARYFEEASSIDFKRSVKYGLGVLKTAVEYFLSKNGFLRRDYFEI